MINSELFKNFIVIHLLDYEVRSFTSIVFQSEKYIVNINSFTFIVNLKIARKLVDYLFEPQRYKRQMSTHFLFT